MFNTLSLCAFLTNTFQCHSIALWPNFTSIQWQRRAQWIHSFLVTELYFVTEGHFSNRTALQLKVILFTSECSYCARLSHYIVDYFTSAKHLCFDHLVLKFFILGVSSSLRTHLHWYRDCPAPSRYQCRWAGSERLPVSVQMRLIYIDTESLFKANQAHLYWYEDVGDHYEQFLISLAVRGLHESSDYQCWWDIHSELRRAFTQTIR